MTLFIACLIIYGLKMDPVLYWWAVTLWIAHVAYHENPPSTKK